MACDRSQSPSPPGASELAVYANNPDVFVLLARPIPFQDCEVEAQVVPVPPVQNFDMMVKAEIIAHLERHHSAALSDQARTPKVEPFR